MGLDFVASTVRCFFWALMLSEFLLQLTDFFHNLSPLRPAQTWSLHGGCKQRTCLLFLPSEDKQLPKSYFMQGDKGFSVLKQM